MKFLNSVPEAVLLRSDSLPHIAAGSDVWRYTILDISFHKIKDQP